MSGRMGVVARFIIISGNRQTTSAGISFSEPCVLQALDEHGAPVENAKIEMELELPGHPMGVGWHGVAGGPFGSTESNSDGLVIVPRIFPLFPGIVNLHIWNPGGGASADLRLSVTAPVTG